MTRARVPELERPRDHVHEHAVRVIFGDTDAAGIAYYANYLRWFEAGRGEMLRARGLPYARLFERGLILPIVEAWMRYRAPAKYYDLVVVATWVHEVGRASVLVGCEISRGDALLARGGARLGCTDKDGKVQPLPAELLAIVAA